jgi:hypothetical protein
MKNLKVPRVFFKEGGTELGCMSTSEKKDVAGDFAKSDVPLLFKIVSNSA